ncbi:GRIP and coiled-coil domain-containing protein PFC0235w isoform X2 [Formica exsecta]|uniref:GRIP and coiled-coil domain-containing protein PFC0235w isoform X2 n=1 Tax=Formica exsecta TaxID=72781 RepID=UPI001144FB85|nr:GRIP and coiled-coil domain-containing protein PFC0235w isoform X2 [Formica exsecta]
MHSLIVSYWMRGKIRKSSLTGVANTSKCLIDQSGQRSLSRISFYLSLIIFFNLCIQILFGNMSDDLLAKEKEFRRLNRELRQKTHDMIKEVDSVINAPDSLFSNESYLNFVTKDVKTIHSEDKTLKTDKQSRTLDGIVEIPENVNNIKISLKKDNSVGNNAIVTLLKGKIDMLYKELQAMQLEYNKKCDYSKELEVRKKKLDDIQVKLHNQIGTLNDTITKLENRNSDTISNCQALSNENVALKKDLESLKKEINILSQQSTNYDVRLNRSLESNEKLKNALKCSQIEEKELRNSIRRVQEDKRIAVKSLEKQRNELVHAFKKQMLLIDNLKKQNVCVLKIINFFYLYNTVMQLYNLIILQMYLMSNGQIRLTEEDFTKLLEWKPQQP